jgi:hypothetical protein
LRAIAKVRAAERKRALCVRIHACQRDDKEACAVKMMSRSCIDGAGSLHGR